MNGPEVEFVATAEKKQEDGGEGMELVLGKEQL